MLHRISQNVNSSLLAFFKSLDISLLQTASRKLCQTALQSGSWGARYAYPQRGLATAAEPYDVVVIGGGVSFVSV
jgi:hypothetical protein